MVFPEHRDLVRQLGADSMVLLKNNGILPISKGKVALFGAGAVDTLFCGIFFNHVYTDKNVNVREGLENNGFTFSTESWLDKMEKTVKLAEKEYSNSNNSRGRKLRIRFGQSGVERRLNRHVREIIDQLSKLITAMFLIGGNLGHNEVALTENRTL